MQTAKLLLLSSVMHSYVPKGIEGATLSTALAQTHSHSLSVVGNTCVNFRVCVHVLLIFKTKYCFIATEILYLLKMGLELSVLGCHLGRLASFS